MHGAQHLKSREALLKGVPYLGGGGAPPHYIVLGKKALAPMWEKGLQYDSIAKGQKYFAAGQSTKTGKVILMLMHRHSYQVLLNLLHG